MIYNSVLEHAGRWDSLVGKAFTQEARVRFRKWVQCMKPMCDVPCRDIALTVQNAA